MIESGLVEIENHSYNSHTTGKGRNGTKKKAANLPRHTAIIFIMTSAGCRKK